MVRQLTLGGGNPAKGFRRFGCADRGKRGSRIDLMPALLGRKLKGREMGAVKWTFELSVVVWRHRGLAPLRHGGGHYPNALLS